MPEITKEERFAIAMSEDLSGMRYDDIAMSELYDEYNREIPNTYIDELLNNEAHLKHIKANIKASVLYAVNAAPKFFKTKENGEYIYSSGCYDHAYAMDRYIQTQYAIDNPILGYRYICQFCGSEHVQTKMWTKPNHNFEFPDEILSEDINDNYCDDCEQNTILDKVEKNVKHKVIGYQVYGDNGSTEEGEMHPNMDGSFCIYSLSQANEMILINNEGKEEWKLEAVWTDTIEEPTFMFDTDPR